MKVYTHSKYSYVRIAEISKSEIKKIDFALCNQPRETLSAFYSRQTEKPDIITNAGFFNMTDGSSIFNYINEGKEISTNIQYQWGIGLTSDTDLIYGSKTSRKWRDFISGYPNLVDRGKKCTIDFATEINYKARRTAIGYNDSTVFLVCIENPGMDFNNLQDVMIDLGCKYAINLDGGGSTKMLHNGKSVTIDSYDRAVDNVVAIYLKPEETKTTTTSTTTKKEETTNMAFLTPDKIIKEKIGSTSITINQKITPDGAVATKYIASYVQKGDLVKPNAKLNNGTGKPKGITVHNTDDITVQTGTNAAEQYARATYPNGNMGGAAVHYWVWEDVIWQQLDDTERGWHAADGSSRRTDHRGNQTGGNLDTIAIECIESKLTSKTEDTLAKLVAVLCFRHGLDPELDVYTHNYWMYGTDSVVQGARKNCPLYILNHWSSFLLKVKKYHTTLRIDAGELSNSTSNSSTSNSNTTNSNGYDFEEGDIVNFTGTTHYTSSYKTGKASTCKPGQATVKKIVKQTVDQPYNVSLVKVTGGTSTVYGWVDPKYISTIKTESTTPSTSTSTSTNTTTTPSTSTNTTKPSTSTSTSTSTNTTNNEIKKGDTVYFSGTKHYTSSYSFAGYKTCKPGQATVTNIITKSDKQPHNIQLKTFSGSTSTVNGWVDAEYVSKSADAIIEVGDKIKIKSGVTKYSTGTTIPSWVRATSLYVRAIEQNGKVYLVSTSKTAKIYTGRLKASDVYKV